jgi:hypothetical protein
LPKVCPRIAKGPPKGCQRAACLAGVKKLWQTLLHMFTSLLKVRIAKGLPKDCQRAACLAGVKKLWQTLLHMFTSLLKVRIAKGLPKDCQRAAQGLPKGRRFSIIFNFLVYILLFFGQNEIRSALI